MLQATIGSISRENFYYESK